MSKQSQASVTEPNRTGRPKVKPTVVEELTHDLAHFDKLPGRLGAAVDGGAIEAQAARLGDQRLQTAQRQALAAQAGRVQGNQQLQRVVAHLKPRKMTRVRTSSRTAKLADSAPGHVYRQEGLALTPTVGQVPVVQKTDVKRRTGGREMTASEVADLQQLVGKRAVQSLPAQRGGV